jgi:hypothetical protein
MVSSHSRGIALTELAIACVLLGVLAISAFPAFQSVQRQRLEAASRTLKEDLTRACRLSVILRRSLRVSFEQHGYALHDSQGTKILRDPWSGDLQQVNFADQRLGAEIVESSFGSSKDLVIDALGNPLAPGVVRLRIASGGESLLRVKKTGCIQVVTL